MDCPQCKGYQLEPKEISPGLLAAVCPKCDGSLLSLMNYRYWIDQHAENSVAEIAEDVITEDSSEAKLCPKCSKFMSRFQIGRDINHRLELCTSCDEAWLDKGEWKLLQQLDIHNKLPKIFTDAWQRNIRLERQEETLKARYRKKLGDDFTKVDEFKQWLDQHVEKRDIRQYLNTTLK
ncbi:MAG: hypothetical protein K6L73_09430 [Cellvibrionaceae bacterium]